MNYPTFYQSLMYSFYRILYSYLLCTYFGCLNGTLLIIFSIILYSMIFKLIFGLERLGAFDKFFINKHPENNFNIGGVIFVNNFNEIAIKNSIIEKLFKRIPKLSAKVTYFMLDYFWEFSKKNDNLLKIYEERIINSTILEKELFNYLNSQINQHLDPFSKPVEFHLIKYSDSNNGCIYIKLNHVFSDGLGCISMIGFLDDNYDFQKYPIILRKTFSTTINFFITFKDYLMGLLFGIVNLFFFFFTKSSVIINKEKQNLSNKELEKFKYYLQNSTNANLSQVISFNLAKVKALAKKLDLTINELCLGIIFDVFKSLSPKSDKIKILVPMGFTSLSKDIKKLQLYNSASGFIDSVKLTDVFSNKKSLNSFKINIRSLTKKLYNIRANQIMNTITAEYFLNIHEKFLKFIYFDLIVSNVPFQEKTIFIGGGKVTKMYPISNPGISNCFITIASYDGDLNISLSLKCLVDMDSDHLLNLIKQRFCDLLEVEINI